MCLATMVFSVISAMEKHPKSCVNGKQAMSRNIGLESFDSCVVLLDRGHHIRLQQGNYQHSRRPLKIRSHTWQMINMSDFSAFDNSN